MVFARLRTPSQSRTPSVVLHAGLPPTRVRSTPARRVRDRSATADARRAPEQEAASVPSRDGRPLRNDRPRIAARRRSDRIGYRPTLCGSRVSPSIVEFHAGQPWSGNRNCATCTNVALRYPADRTIRPLSDIGTAIALIAMLRAARHAPEPQLRECVDLMLATFGAPGGASLLPRVPCGQDEFVT